MYIAPAALRAIQTLEKNGHTAYVVGGCVRNHLLSRYRQSTNTKSATDGALALDNAALHQNDWDICTSALPQQVAECFSDCRIIETGLQHGTLSVLLQDTALEITTFRTDGAYANHRKPSSVQFVRGIEADLARRDFTMNAIAWNPRTGFVDPFSGQADLQNGVIRCVGSAHERLNEDALRIMRALRFASVLCMQPDDTLATAVHTHKSLLASISGERLNKELCQMLCGSNISSVLPAHYDVISVFIPELHAQPHWALTAHRISLAPQNKALRLALLFCDIAPPKRASELADAALRRLKFDNATRRAVCTHVLWQEADIAARPVAYWLNTLGKDAFFMLLQLKRARLAATVQQADAAQLSILDMLEENSHAFIRTGGCWHISQLAVNGHHLLAIGYLPGAAIGKALKRLLALVIQGEVPNTTGALLSKAQEWQDRN